MPYNSITVLGIDRYTVVIKCNKDLYSEIEAWCKLHDIQCIYSQDLSVAIFPDLDQQQYAALNLRWCDD